MFFHPADKERTNYVLRSTQRSAPDKPKLYLSKVPKTVTSFKDKYWVNPKTTSIALFAQFFPTLKGAEDFLDTMWLKGKYDVHALSFHTRPCYSNPADETFLRCREEVHVMVEMLLEEKDKLSIPDVTRARMAQKQLNILLDIYCDWSHSKVPYDVDEEIEFLSMSARIYWHPLNDLQLLNVVIDRIAQRLRAANHPVNRDDLWREYVRVTPAQRQAFVERFRAEVINKRFPPLTPIEAIHVAADQCQLTVSVQQQAVQLDPDVAVSEQGS